MEAKITVTADTKDATSELKKVNASLDAFGKVAKDTSAKMSAFSKVSTSMSSTLSGIGSNLSGMVKGFIAFKAISTVTDLVGDSSRAFIEFERALVGVGKTTNISGVDLKQFGIEITELSKRLPIAQTELLDISQAAGQLGVQGSENLLNFAETIGKLGFASDLSGNEAATTLIRLLNVTGQTAESIDELASVIVQLGNNFAASESEIARVAMEVGKATSAFNISSAQAAAFGAALKSIGVQAELGGSVIGKTFRTIQDIMVKNGKAFEYMQQVTGQTGDQWKKTFETDAPRAFLNFIQVVKTLSLETGSMSSALEKFGLSGDEVNKILPTLAGNTSILEKALTMANEEFSNATALNKEAATAFQTSAAKAQILANSVDSIKISIGERLTPALLGMQEFMLKGFRGVIDLFAKIKKEIGGVAGLVEIFVKNMFPILGLGDQLRKTFSFSKEVKTGRQELSEIEQTIKKLRAAQAGYLNGDQSNPQIISGLKSIRERLTETLTEYDKVKDKIKSTENASSKLQTQLENQFGNGVSSQKDKPWILGQMDAIKSESPKVLSSMDDLKSSTRALASTHDKLAESSKGTQDQISKTNKEVNKNTVSFGSASKATESYIDVIKDLENVGKSQSQQFKETYQKRVAIIKDAESKHQITVKESLDAQRKAQIAYTEKIKELKTKESEAVEKAAEKQRESTQRFIDDLANLKKAVDGVVSDISGNLGAGLGSIFGGQKLNSQIDVATAQEKLNADLSAGTVTPEDFALRKQDLDKMASDIEKNTYIGTSVGMANAVAQGAKGAQSLIKAGISAGATAAFGPMGGQVAEALGPVFDVLMEGPEATKKMVREFAQALPEFIKNIGIALPVIFEELAKAIPDIIVALADNMDVIVEALAEAAPRIVVDLTVGLMKAMPRVFQILVKDLIDKIIKGLALTFNIFKKAGEWIIEGLKDAISGLGSIFSKIFKFDGGGKGGVEKLLGIDFPFVAFAKGGLVGGGRSGTKDSEIYDTIPALLSKGEVVLPKSVVNGGAESVVGFLKSIGAPVGNFGFGSFLKDSFKSVGGAIGSVIDVGSNVVGGALGTLSDLNIPILSDVAGATQQAIDLAASLLKIGLKVNPLDLVTNPVKTIENLLKNSADLFTPYFKQMIGLADGGMVPQGFGNDTFPARLSSGEFVVNNSLTPKLERFLDNNNGQSQSVDNEITNALLLKILSALDRPINVESDVKINQDVFAKVFLNLRRNNQRLA